MLKVIEEFPAKEMFSGEELDLFETPNGNLCLKTSDDMQFYIRAEDVDKFSDLNFDFNADINNWCCKHVLPDDVEDAQSFWLLCNQKPWKKLKTFSFKS